jgi:hypothetical protein
VVDISPDASAPDSLCVNDPTVTERPDGSFLMIYKAVGRARPLPFGGPVVHLIAKAPTPEGPFTKMLKPVFTIPGNDFPAEDPFVWYQKDLQRYYAILKDTHGSFTHTGQSTLTLFTSLNGLDWSFAQHPIMSDLTIRWTDGSKSKVKAMERPQLYFENGQPRVLLCAIDDGIPGHLTYNVRIPLSKH